MDAFGAKSESRARARDTLTALVAANWIPIICLHHFIELARHPDLEIAVRRIDFLKSFSQIAWFGRTSGSNILGGIVDIFEAEVRSILASPDIDFPGICRSVRETLVQYGQPAKIENPSLNDWIYLRPALTAMAVQEQEIASIVHARHIPDHDPEIALLRTIQRRDPATFNHPHIAEIDELAKDLTDRGDRRLTDPVKTAQGFLNKASKHLADALSRSKGTALDVLLAGFDVPQSDVSHTTTLKQFTRIARRRKHARVAVAQIGLDFDQVWPKLRDAKIPSEIIQNTIRNARKSAPRASGSDLGDDYLACLAPYVDAVIVDKRTYEFLSQGARRDPYFRQIVGFFGKAASYVNLPRVLAAYPRPKTL